MRYLSLAEVLSLHAEIIKTSGGVYGVRDFNLLESAVKQSRMTFDGQELYSDIASKAAVLCFSIVMNHPFFDGNKRCGHAAMEVFLFLNGYEIRAEVDEQEQTILDLAAGKLDLKDFVTWVKEHIVKRSF